MMTYLQRRLYGIYSVIFLHPCFSAFRNKHLQLSKPLAEFRREQFKANIQFYLDFIQDGNARFTTIP